jgi:opacity protein-like surface antigen
LIPFQQYISRYNHTELICLRKAVLLICFIPGLLFLPADGYAQVSVGANLDVRSEDPTNGAGVRLEYRLIHLPPLAEIRLRAHASYFSEKSVTQYETHGLRSEVTRELQAFDFGAAALAGVKLGLLSPYAGAGLGGDSSWFTVAKDSGDPSRESGVNEMNPYWNIFFGAEFTLIPYINPFFEYRYIKLMDSGNVDFSESERFSVGIMLRF